MLTNCNYVGGAGIGVAPLSVASRGKEKSSGGNLVLVVGAVLGAFLLLINVLLVACCLHRRANKRITGGFNLSFVINYFL